MESNFVAMYDCNLKSYFVGSNEQLQATSLAGKVSNTLTLIKNSLLSIFSDPTKESDPISAQFTLEILRAKPNAQDGSYVRPMKVDGHTFTLNQKSGSSDLYISTTTIPSETIVLPDKGMVEVKKSALIHYLTTQRRLGNKDIDLSSFDLSNVDLSDVSLIGSKLSQENLLAVISSQGDLTGATLQEGTVVEGLPFSGVRMDGPMLVSLIDGRAKLFGIDVSGKDLSGLSLINVDFSCANFTNTNLTDTNLKRAIFTGADLTGATLKGALIGLTCFNNAKIENAQFNSAIGSPLTEKTTYTSVEELPQLMRGKYHNVYNPKGDPNNKTTLSIDGSRITPTNLKLHGAIDSSSIDSLLMKYEDDVRNYSKYLFPGPVFFQAKAPVSIYDKYRIGQSKNVGISKKIDRLTPHIKMGKNSESPNQTRNGQVPFRDSDNSKGFFNIIFNSFKNFFSDLHDEFIKCRHSATQFVIDVINSVGKVNSRKYSSEKDLANHIPSTTEQTFKDLFLNANEVHLVMNDTYGQFLTKQFEKMKAEGKSFKAMSIWSGNHLMSGSLRISKDEHGEEKYSVLFMEPNIGEASPVHSRAKHPIQFHNQTLLNYIGDEDNYKAYFEAQQESENYTSFISIHDEVPASGSVDSEQIKKPHKKIATYGDLSGLNVYGYVLGENKISVDHRDLINQNNRVKSGPQLVSLVAIMHNGIPAVDLTKLRDGLMQLKSKKHSTQQALLGILGYKLPSGYNLIELALRYGRADDIRIYGELFALVQDKELVAELLCVDSMNKKEIPEARKNGFDEAIKAYNEIKDKLLSETTLL